MPLPAGFLETARALIRADTSPGRGTQAAAGLLAPLYEAAGLPVRRQEDGPGEVNLIAGPGGTGAPGADPSRVAGGALLVTHLDTVSARPLDGDGRRSLGAHLQGRMAVRPRLRRREAGRALQDRSGAAPARQEAREALLAP